MARLRQALEAVPDAPLLPLPVTFLRELRMEVIENPRGRSMLDLLRADEDDRDRSWVDRALDRPARLSPRCRRPRSISTRLTRWGPS
ncbi:MAG TPA: hypothetical protein VMV46_11425 [Thermoanaerobaculia bacterium]|nr:hypothetical protein [Thermoanaerobaculia bacterium]